MDSWGKRQKVSCERPGGKKPPGVFFFRTGIFPGAAPCAAFFYVFFREKEEDGAFPVRPRKAAFHAE